MPSPCQSFGWGARNSMISSIKGVLGRLPFFIRVPAKSDSAFPPCSATPQIDLRPSMWMPRSCCDDMMKPLRPFSLAPAVVFANPRCKPASCWEVSCCCLCDHVAAEIDDHRACLICSRVFFARIPVVGLTGISQPTFLHHAIWCWHVAASKNIGSPYTTLPLQTSCHLGSVPGSSSQPQYNESCMRNI